MQQPAPSRLCCPCGIIILEEGSHCHISLAACTGHWIVKTAQSTGKQLQALLASCFSS